jgi:predicted PurR-regulated permease PerM
MVSPAGASYLLAILAVPVVLHFHLLPAVLAGLAVHVLTVKLASRLPTKWGSLAHTVALAAIVVVVVLGLFGAGFGLWAFLHGSKGMAALLAASAETVEGLRNTLPTSVSDLIPHSMEDLREQITDVLRENAHRISAAGMAGLKTLVLVLLGMVVGGMTALHHFDPAEECPPFAGALSSRMRTLTEAFDKVVFAQVKISAVNAVLTALYLLVALPLFGVRLPFTTVLIPLTFVTNLLPVLGNVISNTLIILISLGISPKVALASYIFLMAIHKLEYLLNARIVGGEVQARAWEILSAMIAMEAIFGIGGLIAAPVAYAWLKAELRERNMV